MKHLVVILALVIGSAQACGINDEEIARVQAEITRLSAVENPNRDTKMALWRLNNRLEQLKSFNIKC